MKIKVKYNNGKLLSNNKDIILNNVADIHEIAKNDPSAMSTELFFGIIKDVDGKKRIFLVAPVRSLTDDDVIYLYVFGKNPRRWHRLDKFTETRTIFDSYDECFDFFMEIERGISDDEESGKSIADELLDEVEDKSREDAERKNFDELCERVKKIEEYRKLTDEIAKMKSEMKNAETHFKFADDEYNKAVEEYRLITREFERKKTVRDTALDELSEHVNKIEELEKRRNELVIDYGTNDSDQAAVWGDLLRKYFGE